MSIPGTAGVTDAGAYLQALLALVLLAGGLLNLLAWARQGQLSAFVSKPVLRGFDFALAITIVVKQLPDALGFALPPSLAGDPFHILGFALTHVQNWYLSSLVVALTAGGWSCNFVEAFSFFVGIHDRDGSVYSGCVLARFEILGGAGSGSTPKPKI